MQPHIGGCYLHLGAGWRNRFFAERSGVKLGVLGGNRMRAGLCLNGSGYAFGRGKRHGVVVHHGGGGLLAAADAGGSDHTHIVAAQNSGQAGQQVLGTSQLAAQAIADPHRHGRRLCITAQHLKVVVEGGHLKHLGHADAHGLGQRDQMAVVQTAKVVVQAVQVLDEHVTGIRPLAQQIMHLLDRRVLGLAALELAFAADALAHVIDGAQADHFGRWVRRLLSHTTILAQYFAAQEPCTAGY